jgi:hypothetical protein
MYRTLDGDSSDVLDDSVPPLSKADVPSSTTLVIHLDTERPLSEPKWVKTGDVQEWIKGMLGRMFWASGDAADGWEQRIEVADPDPVRRGTVPILDRLLTVSSSSLQQSGPLSRLGQRALWLDFLPSGTVS